MVREAPSEGEVKPIMATTLSFVVILMLARTGTFYVANGVRIDGATVFEPPKVALETS